MGVMSVSVPRVSNNLRSMVILSNINSTAANLLNIQNQLSSGQRINRPSDCPYDAAVAGQLQDYLEQKARFQQNIRNATGVISTADASMGSASDLVTRAKTVGLDEIGATSTSETRRSSAVVIDEIINEMVSLGNTQFAGRYIFAGRDTLNAPFEFVTGGIYFGGDTGSVDVSIDYSSASSTSVDASAAFGAVSSQVRGRADLDPQVTAGTLLSDLNRGAGVAKGSITISDGTNITQVDLSGAKTVGDVLAAINAATPATTTAAINAAGDGLEIATTLPGGQITVTNTLGGSTATDLGVYRPTPAGAVLTGQDIDPRLTAQTAVSSIAGVDWASGLQITNGGVTRTIDLSGAGTLEDVMNAVNGAGLYVEARINAAGNGLDVVSRLSGSDFAIGEAGGTTATDLGIRSMAGSTALAALNGGRGVSTIAGDDITITGKEGTVFGVDLSSATTVDDVIACINSAAGNPGTVTASLCATGNGIVITDSSGGAGDLTVDRANYSAAGSDLGILASTSGTSISGRDVNPIRPDGVLSDLLGLRDALLADDTNAISFYTGRLDGDNSSLLERRASIGARQQRMDTVNDRITSEITELQSLLSDRIDLDYATSIVKYSTLQASFEAGLQTAGSFLQLSLINFLGQ